jgi:hypothetical protein
MRLKISEDNNKVVDGFFVVTFVPGADVMEAIIFRGVVNGAWVEKPWGMSGVSAINKYKRVRYQYQIRVHFQRCGSKPRFSRHHSRTAETSLEGLWNSSLGALDDQSLRAYPSIRIKPECMSPQCWLPLMSKLNASHRSAMMGRKHRSRQG